MFELQAIFVAEEVDCILDCKSEERKASIVMKVNEKRKTCLKRFFFNCLIIIGP